MAVGRQHLSELARWGSESSVVSWTSSIIIDYLNQRFEQENVALAYIYCSYKERTDQTPANLVASLLQQLVRRNPVISGDVSSLYNHHVAKGTRTKLSEWSRMLQSEVRRFSEVFIIIDALDECPESEDTRASFLAEIRTLHQNARLVTSRHIPTIKSEFEKAARLEICASDEDVTTYLESRIERESRLARHVKAAPDLQATIISTIRQKAKGMFLLAQLHMNSLAKKQTPRGVRVALDNLPNELDDTYNEAMQRIQSQDEEDAQFAKRVLYWISYAYTPLTVVEIRHALAVEAGDVDIDEEALSDEDILVSVCAGLVTVDQESNEIRLVHYTMQEYFERIRMNWFPGAQTSIATVCLTYISFDAFAESYCRSEKELESRLHQFSFLRYAAQYWGDHAREGMDETVKDLTLEFLEHPIKMMCSNQVVHFSKTGYHGYNYNIPNVTRLHIVASFGLVEIAQLLLGEGADVEAQENSGRTVLHWAARSGHEALIRLLVERGANITERDRHKNTALHLAAKNGHEAVVQLLLQEGANIAVGDFYEKTALHLAAEKGYEAIVRLLLEKGAEVDVKDVVCYRSDGEGQGGTALHRAARRGHEAIVRLLLERGASTAIKDEDEGTALHQAAEGDYEVVARLLLEKNADIAAKDRHGETALHRAAAPGNEMMVRLLLEKKADAFEEDGSGSTAFQLAAAKQHETVVGLLLDYIGEQSSSEKWLATARLQGAVDRGEEATVRLLLVKGADINVARRGQHTLLHLAVARENKAVVRLLVENGADVAARDYFGRTALHWAAARGNESAAQLLLEYGADIAAEDHVKATALHLAAKYGFEAVARLLLEKGASVTATDEEQRTVLDFSLGGCPISFSSLMLEKTKVATESGNDGGGRVMKSDHEAVLRLLIENGVDVTIKDEFGRTSLHHAIHRGQEEVIRLLLEKGVDIGVRDNSGRTALYNAAYDSNEAMLRLLLENGVDVETRHTITGFGREGRVFVTDIEANDQREEGSTILHTAAKQGDEAILRLLLEKGADVNAKDEIGETALHKAARRGHNVVAELLLENGMDINIKGGDLGGTALHRAAFEGHVATVQYLLKKGADINAQDDEGGTPLDWAAKRGHEPMVMLLTSLSSSF